MEWINAEKELPKRNGFYNVFCDSDDGFYISSMWFHEGKWKFDNESAPGEATFSKSWYCNVIQWMPLPEPPKQ